MTDGRTAVVATARRRATRAGSDGPTGLVSFDPSGATAYLRFGRTIVGADAGAVRAVQDLRPA
jgi:hypothetical protein